MTLLPNAWLWSCHYLFFATKVGRGWDSNIQPFASKTNAPTDRATKAVTKFDKKKTQNIFNMYLKFHFFHPVTYISLLHELRTLESKSHMTIWETFPEVTILRPLLKMLERRKMRV